MGASSTGKRPQNEVLDQNIEAGVANDERIRSLDLTLEILENAGASVLAAGIHMAPTEASRLLANYHVNVLTGDSSQIIQFVHHISTLPREERDQIKLDKIIYTSEVLTAAQRMHIRTVLGPVKICSILGSVEAGPWAVSSLDLTGEGTAASQANFVFDERSMLVEILSPSLSEDGFGCRLVLDGEQGVITLTSLARLRNPLVRYVTGDIGSLHPLPEHARDLISPADFPYLRVLRLEGRDRRFSFDWDSDYFEFEDLTSMMEDTECGILQWQVILDKMEPSLETTLEIRLLCPPRDGNMLLSEDVLIDRVRTFFHVYSVNTHRFKIVFIKNLEGFERSSTGRKVIRFINRNC
jgi:phenylacetate-coenzyme A ligase PaaK-like adenylate-forming protein